MKHTYRFWLFCLICCSWVTNSHAQASNCADAYLSPFCSGIAQYPANFDGTGSGSGPQAPAGPNYDCLGTQGNPSYFSLTVQQTGNISFTLDNTANVDIDFILWGPFSSIGTASAACDSTGQGNQWGGVTDCSFSGVSQELVEIPMAQAGEVYILMVTNYANVATNIFSTQNTGTGDIACPCEIPYTVDTLPAAAGNQGFLTDTINGINQFVVCPGNTLGIQLGAKSALNDTLDIYGPFTTLSSAFVNNSIFAFNPNAPTSFDSLAIFGLITPSQDEIGVTDFNIGLQNKLYTGGFSDSSCFDLLDIQVIVPGVRLSDRTVCSGEIIELVADSIPTTTLGGSNYSWSQLSGPTVSFSSTSSRIPTITIPTTSSTNSNDSILILVDYDYGGLCPMSDTMVLRFNDVNITVSASPDSVCVGQTSMLQAILSDTLTPAVCNDYNVNTIPFAAVTGTGTALTLGDDQLSGSLPIGFNFNFFCNDYTNFFISSNGFISFDPTAGSGCCSGQNIPDPFDPNDIIAMCWTDCNPTSGGTIEYFTIGAAPNRQLIVNFINVPPFTVTTGNQTVQAILFEGTNVIELHVTNATPSGTFNTLTLGIENADGTLAHAAPGGNATNTTITNTAFRFEPKNFGPFYSWTPAASLNANDIPNPIAMLTNTTTYSVTIEDGVCAYIDTTTVHALSGLNTPVVMCDSATITSISFSWTDLGLPATGFYEYSLDGGTTWINAGTGFSATATGLFSNTTYTIQVRANDGTGGTCPLSPVGSNNCSTLNPDCVTNPNINIVLTPANLLCNNDSSGCITALVTGGSGNPMNLSWSNGTVDVDSICMLTAGTYTLVVTDTFSTIGGPPSTSTLYAESFDAVHNWTLNVPTGTNGADNNFWVVNSNEAGQPVGACGTSGGSNQSLHITSVFNPNGGAAYDAGGLCGILFCPETSMRAESPTFSTVGQSNLTFEFNYISNGSGLIDNASVWYNDGSGWQQLDPSIKSALCPGGQGEWSKFSMTLPTSCENQPNVQVGIDWVNNDDGVGSDPSVAIDSVLVFASNSGANIISCLDSQTITITEPPVLNLTIDSITNPFCSGSGDGNIYTTVTGGTPTYNYNWSNGNTLGDISGLNSGSFIVTVMDNNGCTDTAQTTLSTPNPIIITINNINNNSCNGTPDGSISMTATGGVGTLSYLWSNGATSNNITAISNGNYVVTVTDANGCSDTTLAIVVPTVSLNVTDTVVNPLCNGNNGTATLTTTGGSGTYTFAWGAASSSITNTATVPAGTFIVTVTDVNNGCAQMHTVTLTAPPALSITLLDTTNIGCLDAPNTGAVDIQVGGGTAPYSFAWNTGATNEDLTALPAGTYSVVVTDDNGCTISGGSYTVEQATAVAVSINTITGNLACDLQAIGSLQAVGTGGSNISYIWSNGATNSTVANLAANSYTVTATNGDGCTDTASQTINAPIIPTVNAYVSVTGMTSVSVPLNSSVTISAGSSSFNYSWTSIADPVTGNANIANPSLGTTTANPDPEGDYTYIVTASATTNDTTCMVTDTVWITVEAPFQGIPTAFTPDGDGVNDSFRPVMLKDEEVKTFRIYNRWGQEIFNGDQSHADGWDGTYKGVPQPMEVYIYLIEYQKASDPEPRTAKGEFTLIR